MEVGSEVAIPRYGVDALGRHNYSQESESGLPKSYAELISQKVKGRVGKTEGIFLDVGGGTGELSKYIAKGLQVKSVVLDYSPVGLAGNRPEGAVSDARHLPIADREVGVLHTKDMVEHLDDAGLASFISEASRVLKADGTLIITEKDYYPGFPFFQKPHVIVESDGKTGHEDFKPGESYAEAVSRIKSNLGDSTRVGVPYYPRSRSQLVQLMEKSGFVYEDAEKWQTKKGEPDWFKGLPRNVMSFKLK
jgi:SAM-dependent methyltransferase